MSRSGGLENVEAWLDAALNVRVAVLVGDAIEFGLKSCAVALFLIECELSSTGVATEGAHIWFDLLSSKFLLVCLELLAVNHCASTSASTGTCGAWGCQSDS